MVYIYPFLLGFALVAYFGLILRVLKASALGVLLLVIGVVVWTAVGGKEGVINLLIAAAWAIGIASLAAVGLIAFASYSEKKDKAERQRAEEDRLAQLRHNDNRTLLDRRQALVRQRQNEARRNEEVRQDVFARLKTSVAELEAAKDSSPKDVAEAIDAIEEVHGRDQSDWNMLESCGRLISAPRRDRDPKDLIGRLNVEWTERRFTDQETRNIGSEPIRALLALLVVEAVQRTKGS